MKSGRRGSRTGQHAADNVPEKGTTQSGNYGEVIGWEKSDTSPFFYMKFHEWGTTMHKPKKFMLEAARPTYRALKSIIDTFGAIVEIIDISVNEKIRYLGTLLGGVPEEDQGSAFDEYDQENGYIEETTQEEIWRSYGDNLDAILQICIKSMRNSYKECLESDLSDLLDYVVFQVEYDREK